MMVEAVVGMTCQVKKKAKNFLKRCFVIPIKVQTFKPKQHVDNTNHNCNGDRGFTSENRAKAFSFGLQLETLMYVILCRAVGT